MGDPLKEYQRRAGWFLYFIMMFNTDQDDPKYKYTCMTCSDFLQLPLDANGIDDSIYNQSINNN